jgi:hypothetical protein
MKSFRLPNDRADLTQQINSNVYFAWMALESIPSHVARAGRLLGLGSPTFKQFCSRPCKNASILTSTENRGLEEWRSLPQTARFAAAPRKSRP